MECWDLPSKGFGNRAQTLNANPVAMAAVLDGSSWFPRNVENGGTKWLKRSHTLECRANVGRIIVDLGKVSYMRQIM